MDEFSNAEPRPLSWDLKFQAAMSANTGTDEGDVSLFVWPEDPDERTLILFSLSQHEYTAIASAIDVGSDIAFGVDAIKVWWLFVKNMRYNVPICAAIIDCITNDADTKQAIVNALKADPDFNQWFKENVYRLTIGQIGGKLVPGDCDDSVVAGRAMAIVERLDQNNKDFLEQVEVGTNDEERVASILEAIPVLDEAPVGDVLDIIQDFLEDFAENYNAISNETRKEAMANEIYCLMLKNEDCSITFQQLFDYFQGKATSGLNILSTAGDVIGFLADGDFDNDDLIWFGMFALQVGFVLNSRDFYGINIGRIGSIMRDASPSSIWEDWGDCPETWTHEFPDADGWSAFTLETFSGATTTESGGKLIGATNSTNDAVFINFKITVDADVQNVAFTIEWSGPSVAPQAFNLYIDTVLVESLDLNALTSPHTLSYPAAETGSHEYELLGGITGSTAGGKFLNATASVWSGNGTDPFA